MAKPIVIIKSLVISLYYVCVVSKPNSNPPPTLFTQQTNNTTTSGFSIDIFHRDSPQSPYYDTSLSHTQRVVNALRRSLDRFQWLNESLAAGSTETDIVRSIHTGDFLMRYGIGRQNVRSLGVLDTGSSLIWTQCFPCDSCIKQHPPLYKPEESSTYKRLLCNETECERSRYAVCHKRNTTDCLYSSSYQDGTFTEGWLSKDMFILASEGGTTSMFLDIVFGCTYKARSSFYGYESGVIGFGRGNDSLVTQLGSSAQGKFSYCLVSGFYEPKRSGRSKLSFGDNAELSGDGVVHTPLMYKPRSSWYYVTVYGFNIDGGIKYMYSSDQGNMIVDSGWAETRLPYNMYKQLESSVKHRLKYLNTIKDPEGIFDLCFQTTSNYHQFPTVTLHFDGDDASVSFGKENMFIRTGHDSLCLAVKLEGSVGYAILGYLAQTNFLVGYDTVLNRMSFKPANCGS